MAPNIADRISGTRASLSTSIDRADMTPPTRNDHKFETTHGFISIIDSQPVKDEGKPLILFLHGNSFCSKIWVNFFASDLAYLHRLVAIDYPGHGESSDAPDPDKSYNMPGYADAALQVLRHLDATRPVIVVGWSLGGHVAIEIALRCDRIKGIVITGTPPCDKLEEIDKAFTFGPGGWQAAAPGRASITEEELQAFAHGCADPPYEDWMEQCVRRTDGRARELMFKHFAESKPDPPGLEFRAIIGPWADKPGQKTFVETSEIPVAVINGAGEPFINLEFIRSIAFKNLWDNTFYEMEACLHAPFWRRPADYIELLAHFIEDVS